MHGPPVEHPQRSNNWAVWLFLQECRMGVQADSRRIPDEFRKIPRDSRRVYGSAISYVLIPRISCCVKSISRNSALSDSDCGEFCLYFLGDDADARNLSRCKERSKDRNEFPLRLRARHPTTSNTPNQKNAMATPLRERTREKERARRREGVTLLCAARRIIILLII